MCPHQLQLAHQVATRARPAKKHKRLDDKQTNALVRVALLVAREPREVRRRSYPLLFHQSAL